MLWIKRDIYSDTQHGIVQSICLIRSKTDRGIVTVLDSRVLAKTYGREFLGSLPTTDYERMERVER